MRVGELIVSFWHIGLENIPEGSFVHHRVVPGEAKRMIAEARRAGRLCCVSHDDLLAPYHKRERRNHEGLCRVLTEHHGIPLSFRDFVEEDEIDGEVAHTMRPLVLFAVEGTNRLLIVNCHYVMAKERKRGGLEFDIEPQSVTFHLFEVAGASP